MNKIFLLFLAFNVFAVNDKINIEADEVLIDKNTNISIYSGDVLMQRGAIELFGEVVKIIPDGDKNYQIKAQGVGKNPAKFINKLEKIKAKAGTILYITGQNFIIDGGYTSK